MFVRLKFPQERVLINDGICKELPIKFKKLFAFDFDHTVVDDNTDIVVRDLVGRDKIPSHVTALYKNSGWIPYMQEIFNILYENGYRQSDIHAAVEGIQEVAGMKSLFSYLGARDDSDVIIISDSNSQFIQRWCRFNEVDHLVERIFTNSAEYDENGRLKIQPHHTQNWCQLSSENLCKGHVLEEFLQSQHAKNGIQYENIVYVGDGNNDVCPILRLGENDFGCARRGYRLEKEVNDKNDKKLSESIEAGVFIWNNGHELMDFVKEKIFK